MPTLNAHPIALSPRIEIVSATKLSDNDFWNHAALGVSLKAHLEQDARLAVNITFENARGLPEIFNAAIDHASDGAILVFIHDDVWIDEANFADAIIAGLESYDIIGVAGNRRRVAGQPAWAFIDQQFTWDDKSNLSGRVAHGKRAFGPVSDFGPVPAECELLDGVFLAARKNTLKTNGTLFDMQFDFHFYDMDFCRTARKAALRLGTWPIKLTHQSGGAFGTPHWREKYLCYLSKWEKVSTANSSATLQNTLTKAEQDLQQSASDLLKIAEARQSNDQTVLAEYLYRQILKIQPKNAEANHNLGLIEIPLKGILAALPRLEIAVMEHPESERYWVSYIEALMQSTHPDIAAGALKLGQQHGLSTEKAQELAAKLLSLLENKKAKALHKSSNNNNNTSPNIHIYQIFYSAQTQQTNDPGFIGLDNLANPRPDWREYWPIRNYLLNNQLNEDDYYGFFSPKFKTKTNLDSSAVHEFISAHASEADVFLFSPFFDERAFYLNIFEQGATAHPNSVATIQDCVALIAPAVNPLTLVMDSRNTVYCNYFVAKPAFWKVWLESCEVIFSVAEEDKTALAANLNANTNHDGGAVPRKVFIIERIASLLLSTQRHWRIKAYNPTLLPYVKEKFSKYQHELLLMDALKIASIEQGYPEYLSEFSEIRQSIIENFISHENPSSNSPYFEKNESTGGGNSQHSLNELFRAALEHQHAGRTEDARHIYLKILNAHPKNADANHNLGMIELHEKGALDALPRLEIAIMEKPENEQFWVSYIDALMLSGANDTASDALILGQQYGLSSETAKKLEGKLDNMRMLKWKPIFPAGHFYSPVIDPVDIKSRENQIWHGRDDLPGIAWNASSQLELLNNVFKKYTADINYPIEQSADMVGYYYKNDQFPVLDAEVLYCMLCHYQPKHMIEVGSGFSSLITADVNRRILNNNLVFTCVEPYPRQFLTAGVPGITQLVVSKVEELNLDFFATLDEGDILFIDSSHVAKTGSDVNYLLFEVIPRLKKGVFIHVHDIFLPDEYPKEWVIQEGRGWNEQYLLRAFLQFNSAFEVIWGSTYMATRFPKEVHDVFPHFPELGGGGSIWLRKTA